MGEQQCACLRPEWCLWSRNKPDRRLQLHLRQREDIGRRSGMGRTWRRLSTSHVVDSTLFVESTVPTIVLTQPFPPAIVWPHHDFSSSTMQARRKTQLNCSVWGRGMRLGKTVTKQGIPLSPEIVELFSTVRNAEQNPLRAYLARGGNPNIQDEWGTPLLTLVVQMADAKFVTHLLLNGADPSIEGDCVAPLSMATRMNHVAIAKLLIKFGADPKAGALFHIALNDSSDVARLLIRSGADVNHYYQGSTPLHEVAELGSLQSMKVLLSNGACLDARDQDGNTLLHRVAQIFNFECHAPIVELAAHMEARFDLINDSGQTILDVARDATTRNFLSEIMRNRKVRYINANRAPRR